MQRQRYFLEMGVAAALYVVTTLTAGLLSRQMESDDAWRIPLALLPALPAVAMVAAIARHVLRMDELEQRIHAVAALITLLVIMAGSFVYGFLESYAGFPSVSMFWPALAGFAGWSLLHPLVRKRYA